MRAATASRRKRATARLLSVRDATLRYARKLRLLYTHRKYSHLTGVAPKEARTRFQTLIEIGLNGSSQITPAFQSAIDQATQAARSN